MKEIVFYDSGIGGITLLNEARLRMPKEHFVYFADNLNVPYGSTKKSEMLDKVTSNLEREITTTTKAVVIACNTITSQGITEIRKSLNSVQVFGIEPEIKTATKYNFQNALLIATPKTCEIAKNKIGQSKNITLHPSKNLASIIEKEIFNKEAIYREIIKIKKSHSQKFDALILGCTHYALVKDVFRYAFPDGICIFDGVCGTVKNISKNIKKERKGFGSLKLILTNNKTGERLKYARLIN